MQYFIELFIILTFFILPPIFTSTNNSVGYVEFNIFHIITYGFLGVYCFLRSKKIGEHNLNSNPQKGIFNKKNLLFFFGTLVFLFINGIFWKWISKNNFTKVENIKTIYFHIFQVFGLFIYASYEEIMYRSFLPLSLEKTFSKSTKKENISKGYFIFIEILCLLLFSFGHIYMGIFAVFNGLFAGIALRFLAWKTKSIFPNVIVHFIYNFVLYVLMFTSL